MSWIPVLAIINGLGLMVMGIDKRRAIRHHYRVAERTLFIIAICGGSLGIWAGMYLFRHKTRHLAFVIGIPVILIAQIILLYLLFPHLT